MDQDLNRAEQLWYNWEEKQQQLERPTGTGPDTEANPGGLGLLIRNKDQKQVHINDLIKIVEQSKKPEVGRPLTLIKQKEPEKGQGQSITVN